MKVKPVLLYHKTTLLICSLTSLLVTLLLCLHMWFTFTCTEVKVVAAGGGGGGGWGGGIPPELPGWPWACLERLIIYYP